MYDTILKLWEVAEPLLPFLAMGIFGEVFGAALGWAGEKPEVPKLEEIDVQEQQKKAIAGNVAALPEIGKISSFATEQRARDIETLAPGTAALRQQTSGLISQMLAGELPKDVEEYIKRKSAAQAISSGTAGSEFARNRTLRDLGLTSLQMQQQGLPAAQRWIEQANAAPTFNFSSMLVSPEFQSQFAFQQAGAQWQNQWLSNQIAAMPSPLENAMMSSLRKFDDLTWQVAGTAAGMGMGGIGGMGGGGGGGQSQPAPTWGQTYGGFGGFSYDQYAR